MTPVVCLLPVRNAVADLERFFATIGMCADAVVALDDGSTDRTRQMLNEQRLVSHVIESAPRESYEGWDDSANRRRLLVAAADLDPQWIIQIDADECIDGNDAIALRRFLLEEGIGNVAYGMCIHRMLNERGTIYDKSALFVYRIFRYSKTHEFPTRRLHFEPVPTCISRNRWVRTALRIKHFAGTSELKRLKRFQKYREVDPLCEYQASYDNLLDPPRIRHCWVSRDERSPVLLDTELHQRIRDADHL